MASRGFVFRLQVITGVIGLLIVAGVAAWLLRSPNGAPTGAGSGWPTGSMEPSSGTVPFTADRAATINADIATGDRVRFADAVVVGPGVAVSDAVLRDIANTGPWQFDLATLRYLGDDVASVSVRATGRQSASWQAYLLFDSGLWKVAVTEQEQG